MINKTNSKSSVPEQVNDNPYKPNMDEYNANLNPPKRLSPTRHKK